RDPLDDRGAPDQLLRPDPEDRLSGVGEADRQSARQGAVVGTPCCRDAVEAVALDVASVGQGGPLPALTWRRRRNRRRSPAWGTAPGMPTRTPDGSSRRPLPRGR